MPTISKSQTTIDAGRRLPQNRPPTHPGEMLLEEFIKPLHLTQAELARCLEVSYLRLNEIISLRRSMTPDTALRLSWVLGISADFWLGLQQDWDLWHAMNSPEANRINRLSSALARHGIWKKCCHNLQWISTVRNTSGNIKGGTHDCILDRVQRTCMDRRPSIRPCGLRNRSGGLC